MTDRYTEIFREEARDLLGELETALLEMEQQPNDPGLIGRTFRALHTLKGSAGMVGLTDIESLVHELESVFDQVRCERLQVSSNLVSLSLAVRDQLRSMLDDLDQPSAEALVARQRLTVSLRALLPEGAKAPAAGADTQAGARGQYTYHIRLRPDRDLFRKGIQPTGLLQELARLGDCRIVAQTDAIPSLADLDPEACHLYWDAILTTDADEDAIRDLFVFVADDCSLEISTINADDWLDTEAGSKRLGEILVEHGDLSPEDLELMLQQKKKLGEALLEAGLVSDGQLDAALTEQQLLRSQHLEKQARENTSSIRVRSDKLDQLVDLIGELVTVQARLSQLAQSHESLDLGEIAEEVERLTWDMRDHILNIRMLPIGTTFSRFRRLVRDLGRELGKEVELITSGGETELDKTVIERLSDPLIHLIRNAIGHGIESPEERQALGKRSKGRIFLSAYNSGPNVILEIRDDGTGLDHTRIRQRALELGLLTSEQNPTAKEVYNLVFTPGFSTSRTLSRISGRGVGMDVVKQGIEALRGSIELNSREHEGTSVTIKLPLTLAIIDGLLVQVGKETFVLPLGAVQECVELQHGPENQSGNRQLVQVRGEIVPYLSLRERFSVPGTAPAIEQMILIEAEGQRVGFVVDEVIGQHQTVIKGLGRMYQGVRGLSGATILGDGTVALILDLPPLVQDAEREQQQAAEDYGLQPA